MKWKLLALGLIIIPLRTLGAAGLETEIHCWGRKGSSRHTIRLKVDRNGTIVPWSRDKLAMASPKSVFSILLLSPWSYTSVHFTRDYRHYSIVKVHTNLARAEFGIAPKLDAGYYNYVDLNGGNEDIQILLDCSPKPPPQMPARSSSDGKPARF